MKGFTIDELFIDQTASFTKTITEHDVYTFAGITGDFNPAHINDTYAKDSMFGGRIAHGILTAGFISTVIGTQLPGPGTIYLKQNLTFTAPVRMGDTVTAIVKVISKNEERNRAELETICKNQNGEEVIRGKAEVMPPK